jgi:hypothetical protein
MAGSSVAGGLPQRQRAAGGPCFTTSGPSAYRDMLEAGVDPLTAMDVVGHKTMAMAKRSAVRNTRHMAAAIEHTPGDTDTTRTKKGPPALGLRANSSPDQTSIWARCRRPE